MGAMRIAVIGAGAVGGYFGGRLAQAGHDVLFCARGRTLEALRTRGLRIESVAGDFTIDQPAAAESLAGEAPADLVFIAVKAWQVADATAVAAPVVGPDTVVVPLQNGLEAPERIAAALGRPEAVLGGLCKIFAQQSEPGVIVHGGLEPTIELGELDGDAVGGRTPRVQRLLDELGRAQAMTVVAPESIRAAMWEKLLYVESAGTVGAATRQPIGVVRSTPESRDLLERALTEVVTLGRATGVDLNPALPQVALARLDALPHESTTSMHRDLAAGRPSELLDQTGAVVRIAAEAGVDVPVHDILYAALLPGEKLARGGAAG